MTAACIRSFSAASGGRPLTILLFANSVTLAHLVRPMQIGRALAAAGHQVVLAAPDYWPQVLGEWSGRRRGLGCPTPAAFLDTTSRSRTPFTEDVIRSMVKEDLRLIDEIRPDVVVGDLRISLGISARLRQVPYAGVVNAYWNPAAQVLPWPIPEHALARIIGVPLASTIFRAVQPLVRRQLAAPLDAVRRSCCLPPLDDFRRFFCDADLLLHPDPPGLVPMVAGGTPRIEIGHLAWAPKQDVPSWWDRLPAGRSCIYIGMGSSGAVDRLDAVVEGALRSGLPVVVTTAGRTRLRERPGLFAADWLPGDLVAARARIVVCNGGSPSAYQALAAGAPVLGLASNLDQYLAMGVIEQAGLGCRLRAGQATADRVEAGIQALLTDEVLGRRVSGMSASMAACDPVGSACTAIVHMSSHTDLRRVG